jgi:hypothetical protein
VPNKKDILFSIFDLLFMLLANGVPKTRFASFSSFFDYLTAFTACQSQYACWLMV